MLDLWYFHRGKFSVVTLRQYAKKLEELAKLELTFGLHREEGRQAKKFRRIRKDGTVETGVESITVAEAAIANEYGTARIPARPVYRSLARHPETRAIVAGAGLKMRDTDNPRRMVSIFAATGARLVSRLEDAIVDRTDPVNAARTIAEKGKDDPLRNTDQFLESQSFAVYRSGLKVR